ncbi:MAG: hypothetical protein HY001_05215 [Candidatus Portnoybacteria bacterium]|nr:hypothetical protein [Candidatus Portnoybacteria bacterium]
MKYYTLAKEEKQILKDFGKDTLKSISNVAEQKKLHQGYAKATLNKTRNINIRTSQRDLQKIKARAVELGIPYQTFISSLIHRAV